MHQKRRVIDEVEQVTEPASVVLARPTVQFESASSVPPRTPNQHPATARRRYSPAHLRTLHSLLDSTRCRPSPCARLSPARSTTTAPPHPRLRPASGLSPTHPPGEEADGGTARMVPTFTAVRSTGEAPGSTPAASPWLRRRPSPWPPGPREQTRTGSSPPADAAAGTHREPAHIHRVRAGVASRGVTTPVPRVYLPVSLTGPGPSGSPGPTRLCRGCSHPPRRSPGQAASSFTPPLRRQGDEGLSPPSGPTAPRGALLVGNNPAATETPAPYTCTGSPAPVCVDVAGRPPFSSASAAIQKIASPIHVMHEILAIEQRASCRAQIDGTTVGSSLAQYDCTDHARRLHGFSSTTKSERVPSSSSSSISIYRRW